MSPPYWHTEPNSKGGSNAFVCTESLLFQLPLLKPVFSIPVKWVCYSRSSLSCGGALVSLPAQDFVAV